MGELDILSHRDEELKIVKYDWENTEAKNFLEATFTPLSPAAAVAKGAKGGMTMRVVVKPGLPLGVTKQAIMLTTNYQGIEPQTVNLEIRVAGDITVVGPKVRDGTTVVTLGTVDQKAGLTHTVYLYIKGPHRQMTDVQIASIEPAGSLMATLEPELTDSPNVRRIPIKLEVPAGAPLGNYLGTDNSKTGRITLKTNHPQIKQIVIPVLFLVR